MPSFAARSSYFCPQRGSGPSLTLRQLLNELRVQDINDICQIARSSVTVLIRFVTPTSSRH